MGLTLAALLLATASSAAAEELPVGLDLETIRALPVQHDGRWPPLDTLARDVVESVTGEVFFQGHDPLLVLLAWTFDPQRWQEQPLIAIRNAALRVELRLSPTETLFSYAELSAHEHLRSLMGDLAQLEPGRKLDPLESKVSDIKDKLDLLRLVFDGRLIRPIPAAEAIGGLWQPIALLPRGETKDDPVRAAWSALRSAFLSDDTSGFADASRELVSALEALPAAHRPASQLIATELRYNKLRPFRTAWMVMAVGAALAGLALLVRRVWFDALTGGALLAGFAAVSYGLSLRWQIAGRIPAANMFESLLFLGWGMGAFAFVWYSGLSALRLFRALRRPSASPAAGPGTLELAQVHRVVPLTASVMGALSLFLADVLPIDHYVRPIAPVLLDTIWMSIHVPIIMVSYSVLALAVLIAHVQLVLMAAAPRRRDLATSIDSVHYWYVHVGSILLVAGIITGSMWAASSWGRYWGWDPKEVWSLIAFLGYMAILHVRIDRQRVTGRMYALGALLGIGLFALVVPKLAPLSGLKLLAFGGTAVVMIAFVLARGEFATALKSILAFWLIIMTYVGVNFVLGTGLHSYGFGTGAVVRYLFLIGGIDLALIALCGLVYLARQASRPSAPGLAPASSA